MKRVVCVAELTMGLLMIGEQCPFRADWFSKIFTERAKTEMLNSIYFVPIRAKVIFFSICSRLISHPPGPYALSYLVIWSCLTPSTILAWLRGWSWAPWRSRAACRHSVSAPQRTPQGRGPYVCVAALHGLHSTPRRRCKSRAFGLGRVAGQLRACLGRRHYVRRWRMRRKLRVSTASRGRPV